MAASEKPRSTDDLPVDLMPLIEESGLLPERLVQGRAHEGSGGYLPDRLASTGAEAGEGPAADGVPGAQAI